MQLQSLFDSVCRCFGHPGGPNYDPAYHGADADGHGHDHSNDASNSNSNSNADSRRRNLAHRLGLKDKEWDELFGDAKGGRRGRESGTSGAAAGPTHRNRKELDDPSSKNATEAQAVAEAKLAANPSRHRTKRRRSSSDIFRKKNQPNQIEPPYRETISRPNTLSRLLNPSLALCFATPVRGTRDEVDIDAMQSIDNSDTNTLNTCEDTITSTVCFDAKYSHIVETRPPMPLFNQFKIGHEEDEIHHVIATDSHSSLKMIELLQQVQQDQRRQHQLQQQQQQQQQLSQRTQHTNTAPQTPPHAPPKRSTRPQPGHGFQGSSTDSDEMEEEDLPPVLARGPNNKQDDEDGVPGVKAVSSSADSSKQTVSSSRSQSRTQK